MAISSQKKKKGPRLLTYSIIVLIFLRPWEHIDFLLPVHLTLFSVVIGLIYLLFSGLLQQLWSEGIPGLRLFTAYYISGGLSIPWSYWPSGSWESFSNELSLFVMYLLMVTSGRTSIKMVGNFYKVLVCIFFIHAWFLVGDYISHGMGSYRPEGAFGGLFQNANHLGCMLVMVLPISYFCFTQTRTGIVKFFFGGSFLFFLVAIIATQSRGAILTVILLFGIWLIIDKGKSKVVGIFFLTITVTGIIVFAPSTIFDRFALKYYSGEDSSAQGRLYVWKRSGKMLIDHPLTGVGLGQFGVALNTDYLDDEYFDNLAEDLGNNPMLRPHNIFVTIYAELGLLGFIPFMLLLIIYLKMLYKMQRKTIGPNTLYARYTLLALLGFMISNVFDHLAHSAALYYLFALCALSLDFAKQENMIEGPDRTDTDLGPASKTKSLSHQEC